MTYGRVATLEESIASFLTQDYQGPKEMLVFNTFEKQKLLGEFPNVGIVNHSPRPGSLGEARNLAVEQAKGEWIVILDDDDVILPQHLSNFGFDKAGDSDWLWLSHQFYLEAFQIKKIVQGTPNVLAFRKSAWLKVGGYPALDVAEDRVLMSKLMALPGKKMELTPRDVSYCYGWQNAVFHVSGKGDAKPGLDSGHNRIGNYTEALAEQGVIPVGDVLIEPDLLHDYSGMAKEFLAPTPRQSKGLKPAIATPYKGDLAKLNPVPKITLVYIYVPGDPEHLELAGKFVSSYAKFPPGIPHDTVIIANGKGPDSTTWKLLKTMGGTLFRHDDSGHDIGAFLAVSPTLNCDFAIFCGGKTYFQRAGWMVRMAESWIKHGPGLYGSLSSYEVSPHLNTSGFWCAPKAMCDYPIRVANHSDRYDFEHGPNAMWRFCIRRGMPVKLVTFDGEYDWPDWRKPDNIYRRGNQSNVLTGFKHTMLYDQAEPGMRGNMELCADRITDLYFLKALKKKDYRLKAVGGCSVAHFKEKHNMR